MTQLISGLLEGYEQGRVTRRQLILGLGAVAGRVQVAAGQASTFRGVGLNHIALRVTNIERSRDFYQKHFGLPVLSQSQNNCFLGLGRDFLALFKNPNPAMDHYCIAIENFNADAAMEELKRQGLSPRRPSSSDRIYFPDPDGLEVQLSAADHRP